MGINKQKREHMYNTPLREISWKSTLFRRKTMGLQALQYSMSLSFVYRCKADVLQFNVQSTIGFLHLVESTFCCVNVWLCRPIESTFGGLTYSRFDVLWVVVLEYRRSLGRHFTEAPFFPSKKLNHVYRLCTVCMSPPRIFIPT